MVKRVEITYDGGHKEIIQYERMVRDTKEERIYVDNRGAYITVVKAKILQIKDML